MVRFLPILLMLGLFSCKTAQAQGVGSVKTEQYQAECEKNKALKL